MKFAQLITDSGAKYICRPYADGTGLEARYVMAQAAMLAGLSYGSESAGVAHAMSQSLDGIIPVAHGQCAAAMMGPVMEFNWKDTPEKFARMALAFGIDTYQMSTEEAAKAASWMYELVEDLDVPNLADQGVPTDKKAIDRFADAAMGEPQTAGNPRDIKLDDYKWMYKRCFNQNPKTV